MEVFQPAETRVLATATTTTRPLYESDKADPNSEFNRQLATQLKHRLGRGHLTRTSDEGEDQDRDDQEGKGEEIDDDANREIRIRMPVLLPGYGNSQGCYYFKNPDFSDGWRREKSRRPPWSEDVTAEIEEEIDVLVIEEIEV